jgi:hypothetical protein
MKVIGFASFNAPNGAIWFRGGVDGFMRVATKYRADCFGSPPRSSLYPKT